MNKSSVVVSLSLVLAGCCGEGVHLNPVPLPTRPMAPRPLPPDGGWSCAAPSFASQVVYLVGLNYSVTAADFNGDRWPDVAVSTANGLDVLYGLPDGGGLAPATVVASGSEGEVVAGDFNGDGKIDWLLPDDAGLELLLNRYPRPPSMIQTDVPVSGYLAAGYLKGDAGLDLVMAGGGGSVVFNAQLLSGGREFPQPTLVAGSGANWPTIGDFNGDGLMDIAFADYVGCSLECRGNLSIVFNRGGGQFEPPITYPAGVNPWAVVGADFDGNGSLDLAVTNSDGDSVIVYLNDGGGGFTAGTPIPTGYCPQGIVAADFNGDGRPDLAYTDTCAGTVGVLINQGSGTFGPEMQFDVGDYPWTLVVGDFNGDRKPDLAVSNLDDGTVSVLFNQCGR